MSITTRQGSGNTSPLSLGCTYVRFLGLQRWWVSCVLLPHNIFRNIFSFTLHIRFLIFVTSLLCLRFSQESTFGQHRRQRWCQSRGRVWLIGSGYIFENFAERKKEKCKWSCRKSEINRTSVVIFGNGLNLPLRWGVKKVDMVLCLVLGISILVWVKERATSTLYPSPLRNGLSCLEIGRARCFWSER